MIDTHAHLDHLEDLDAALARAAEAGVHDIIAVSENLATSQVNLAIKEQHRNPRIFLGCGIHPSEAHKENLSDFMAFLDQNIVMIDLIGEIGLDFWYRWARKDVDLQKRQIQVFQTLLEFAKDHDRPVSIHTRGAWKEAVQIVAQTGIRHAVFHWYSGPLDVLDQILEKGFYISVTPSLAYSPEAQAVARHTPLNRILVETDTPVYYRNKNTEQGFSAEPADVLKTAALLSRLRDMPVQEISCLVTENAGIVYPFITRGEQ